MNYRCILNTMGDISKTLYSLVNDPGNDYEMEIFKDKFICYGKVYEDVQDCVECVGIEERKFIRW